MANTEDPVQKLLAELERAAREKGLEPSKGASILKPHVNLSKGSASVHVRQHDTQPGKIFCRLATLPEPLVFSWKEHGAQGVQWSQEGPGNWGPTMLTTTELVTMILDSLN